MKKLISLLLLVSMCAGALTAFAENTTSAAVVPTAEASEQATPSVDAPSEQPVQTESATAQPTAEPTSEPTTEPTPEPTPEPTEQPKNLIVAYDNQLPEINPQPVFIDGAAMVPIRPLAEYIGFRVQYFHEYRAVVLWLGSEYISYNIGSASTQAFGQEITALAPTIEINDTTYVSLITFAELIGSEYTVTDFGADVVIGLQRSKKYDDHYFSQPVNQWGIASRTNYMVWVSLSEYTVRLYQGQQYKWELMGEYPCAIGAPGTPTVTGSFEYQYKTQWNYNGYYVGPCLVFYRGYALHSVLLRYDNTEYDGRTGVQISHGCIRMKKNDIDFIANTIPVGTRIYLTK